MKNMTVAILENRAVYGKRLASFISRQENSPFNVQLYLEHPASTKKWEKSDVILITSSLIEVYEDELKDIQLMILDEDGKGFEKGGTVIYKYQSAAVIYTALLDFCMDKSGKRLMNNCKQGREWMLIGIYTPLGGEDVTDSVLSMCRQMAVNRRVLYLNMEQVPVFQEMHMENDRQEGMSDLIYYVKQRSRNLGIRLGKLVIKGEFDYLLPAATPVEVGELTADEWQYCLDCIRDETDYENVIIDFGTAVPSVFLVDQCSEWKIISRNTLWEQRLIRQFKRVLGRLTDRNLEGVIKEYCLEEIRNAEIQG